MCIRDSLTRSRQNWQLSTVGWFRFPRLPCGLYPKTSVSKEWIVSWINILHPEMFFLCNVNSQPTSSTWDKDWSRIDEVRYWFIPFLPYTHTHEHTHTHTHTHTYAHAYTHALTHTCAHTHTFTHTHTYTHTHTHTHTVTNIINTRTRTLIHASTVARKTHAHSERAHVRVCGGVCEFYWPMIQSLYFTSVLIVWLFRFCVCIHIVYL